MHMALRRFALKLSAPQHDELPGRGNNEERKERRRYHAAHHRRSDAAHHLTAGACSHQNRNQTGEHHSHRHGLWTNSKRRAMLNSSVKRLHRKGLGIGQGLIVLHGMPQVDDHHHTELCRETRQGNETRTHGN